MHVSTMWLIVRAVAAVPGVQLLGVTFDNGKGIDSSWLNLALSSSRGTNYVTGADNLGD